MKKLILILSLSYNICFAELFNIGGGLSESSSSVSTEPTVLSNISADFSLVETISIVSLGIYGSSPNSGSLITFFPYFGSLWSFIPSFSSGSSSGSSASSTSSSANILDAGSIALGPFDHILQKSSASSDATIVTGISSGTIDVIEGAVLGTIDVIEAGLGTVISVEGNLFTLLNSLSSIEGIGSNTLSDMSSSGFNTISNVSSSGFNTISGTAESIGTDSFTSTSSSANASSQAVVFGLDNLLAGISSGVNVGGIIIGGIANFIYTTAVELFNIVFQSPSDISFSASSAGNTALDLGASAIGTGLPIASSSVTTPIYSVTEAGSSLTTLSSANLSAPLSALTSAPPSAIIAGSSTAGSAVLGSVTPLFIFYDFITNLFQKKDKPKDNIKTPDYVEDNFNKPQNIDTKNFNNYF